MSDVAAALAPVMPIIVDIAGTALGAVAVIAIPEGVSILSHWVHVDVSAKAEASLELAAENAAKAIVAKSVTANVVNEAFSVNDPRIQAAAKWIVHESTQHAAAVEDIAVTVDDMAHKILSKLGGEQAKMVGTTPVVVAK